VRPAAPVLDFADIKAIIHEPSCEPVTWVARTLVPRREVRVIASVRSFARNIGAQLLGVPPDRVVVGRIDTMTSGAGLDSKGAA
jgi:hypothetical protein